MCCKKHNMCSNPGKQWPHQWCTQARATDLHQSSPSNFKRIIFSYGINGFKVWSCHTSYINVVNPHIAYMFKIAIEILSNIVSEEYEAWIVQDQTLCMWLLSTISKSVLPRVLSRKHAYEAWGKFHKHFHS